MHSFNLGIGAGDEKVSQLLISAFVKEGRLDHRELQALWNPVLDAFQQLFEVVAGPWRFAFFPQGRPGKASQLVGPRICFGC